MWGGWALFSLFSLTRSQPQHRYFSSGVFTHHQKPLTACSDKMAHLSSSKRSGACGSALWGGELQEQSFVIDKFRELDWLWVVGTENRFWWGIYLFIFLPKKQTQNKEVEKYGEDGKDYCLNLHRLFLALWVTSFCSSLISEDRHLFC